MRFIITGLLLSCFAQAAFATDLAVGFGASVPKEGGVSTVESVGPSRATGGELFTISFRDYKTIQSIRITDYSASHLGKLLIHSAVAFSVDAKGNVVKTQLVGLSQFAAATNGNPTNYQNMVMLEDGKFVEVDNAGAFYMLQFQIEGFTNNDRAMLMQITTAEGLNPADYVLKRTGDSEIAGSYIDEANYSGFSIGEVQSLVKTGAQPAMTDLAGHSFTCSIYSKTAAPSIDFKTRTWYDNNGALQSSTNLDGKLTTWSPSQQGWTMPTDNKNGCGHYTTQNIIRKTASGNMISEVVLNRYNYLTLCSQAGYDWNAQSDELNSESYPSEISGDYRTLSYEFCRPAILPTH